MAARRQLTTPDATIPYASRPISVPGVERATTVYRFPFGFGGKTIEAT